MANDLQVAYASTNGLYRFDFFSEAQKARYDEFVIANKGKYVDMVTMAQDFFKSEREGVAIPSNWTYERSVISDKNVPSETLGRTITSDSGIHFSSFQERVSAFRTFDSDGKDYKRDIIARTSKPVEIRFIMPKIDGGNDNNIIAKFQESAKFSELPEGQEFVFIKASSFDEISNQDGHDIYWYMLNEIQNQYIKDLSEHPPKNLHLDKTGMIEFPRGIGGAIYESLEKKKIVSEPRKSRIYKQEYVFTPEELATITRLHLKGHITGELDSLQNLPNLKELYIKNINMRAGSAGKEYFKQNFLNDNDIDIISNLTNLTSLEICGQHNVTHFNVSNLKNLSYLSLVENKFLEDVEGLQRLSGLDFLEVYGNDHLLDIKGLNKAILSNPELSELHLDLLLFPSAINHNVHTHEIDEKAVTRIREIAKYGSNAVTWNEHLTPQKTEHGDIKLNCIKTPHRNMEHLHNRAIAILNEQVPEKTNLLGKMTALYQYVTENVTYNHEALQAKDNGSIFGRTIIKSKDGLATVGVRDGANGAHDCIVEKTCVCEGYTRGMQYLLKLAGINSHNVGCRPFEKRDDSKLDMNESFGTSHSILCIDDFYGQYCDPCWDASHCQRGDKSLPYYLRTKEDISKSHELWQEEYVMSEEVIPRNAIQAAVADNTSFVNARTTPTQVEQAIGIFAKQPIKGQIINDDGRVQA